MGGTCHQNQQNQAKEHHNDLFMMWTDYDYLVYITDGFERAQVLRDFTKNPDIPLCNNQLVGCIMWQYNLATYLQAGDSCLLSTIATQGNSSLFQLVLIDIPLIKSSWEDCLTLTKNACALIVTFNTINHIVMLDDTNNEIEYIKTNLVNLTCTLTVRMKQEVRDSELLSINVLHSSGNIISTDELHHRRGRSSRGKGNWMKDYWWWRRNRFISNWGSCQLLTKHHWDIPAHKLLNQGNKISKFKTQNTQFWYMLTSTTLPYWN